MRLVHPAASLTLQLRSHLLGTHTGQSQRAGLTWLQKALGAETYAISHSDSKKKDCVERMGLDEDKFLVRSVVELRYQTDLVSHDPKRAPSNRTRRSFNQR